LDIANIILVAVLIAFTAFFVASEFSIIRVRPSRIDQLVEEGHPKARAAKEVTSNIDEYLSTTQLGITITSLGLGWLGEPTAQSLLKPILNKIQVPEEVSTVLSFLVAFIGVTILNVVIGELAPKTIAIQKAEQVSLSIAKPLIWFHKVLFPFIWILNHSSSFIVKQLGFKDSEENAHSEEELRMILTDSYQNGEINSSEFNYVNKIFDFDDRIAKEIMVPRTEIISFDKEQTIQEFIQIAKQERYTRYPIIEEDKDHIIGLVNMKEVFADLVKQKNLDNTPLTTYLRPIIRVMENTPIQDMLVKMQKERIHMAILMDEYGGTSGLVTVEDILEEIVGEIRDEFDVDEVAPIRKLKDGHFIVDAKIRIEEVNNLLGIHLEHDEVDTIGGWLLTEEYEIQTGDVIEKESFLFKVVKMEDHSIKYIEITKQQERVTLHTDLIQE
jgi:CBS domain containing-hemolysin-like protein